MIWRFKEHEDVVFQLFTGDKDLKQLLDDRVYVVSPDKEIPYKKADFLRDYGFEPALIVDYLALLGDSADNVKGVMGIGEKKALTLVQEYGSIEHMYEQLSQISVSVRNILEAGKEDAFQSKRLIELAKIDMSDKKLENFAFGLDLALWMEVLGDRYHFSSLKKTLSEMKKEAEKPQQL